MDILYAKDAKQNSASIDLVQSLSEYYGLQVETLIIGSHDFVSQILKTLETQDPKAMIIDWDAIAKIATSCHFFHLVHQQGSCPPVLIMGPDEKGDSGLLRKLSANAIIDLKSHNMRGSPAIYRFADLRDITCELSGKVLEAKVNELKFFETDQKLDVQSIIQVESGRNKIPYRVFVKVQVEGLECFFLSQDHLYKMLPSEPGLLCQHQDCSQLLALAMFLRYAGGDYCWHSPGYCANLTIDDPWLTEPYGDVSYLGLLEEMKRTGFHSTFSFIPWNYDRSEPEVTSVFRDHPDNFSICIHGNNHDHYEFYKYETSSNDPWPAKSIEQHETNIKQALARMEEFKRLTGIPYDLVMVFPHGIAPDETLELLKKYNFLATLNIDHVPLGSDTPTDLLFRLRPFTMRFGNFLSFKRFSPLRWSEIEIAVCLFFNNPLLFSGHHYLFKNGIDTFNQTAEFVNRLQPDVEWISMGQMARRMYFIRKREKDYYDVRAYSKCIEIKNMHDCEKTYVFRKRESFHPAVKQVTINAESHAYERVGADIAFNFSIPPGKFSLINIEYENDFDLNAVDISKNDTRAKRLRRFADLRDLTLTKYSWGRAIIKRYYGGNFYN